LAKTGQTEAMFQQFQHFGLVVRAGQASFSELQIINLYFYFHHRLAGLDGILSPSLRQYSVVSGNRLSTVTDYRKYPNKKRYD